MYEGESIRSNYAQKKYGLFSVEDVNRHIVLKGLRDIKKLIPVAAEYGGLFDKESKRFKPHFEYNPKNGSLIPARIRQGNGFISEQNIIRRKGMVYLSGYNRVAVVSKINSEKSINQTFKNGVMYLNFTRPIAFFDLETTGTDTVKDKIVEIAVTKLFPDQSRETLSMRINPEIPIPAAATAVHGISNEDVAHCATWAEVAPRIHQHIQGCDLGGFNSNRFDIPFIYAQFLSVNIEWDYTAHEAIDVREIFVQKESRTLAAAVKFYTGVDLVDAHSAEADINATVDVFIEQIKKYPDLPGTVPELALFCNYGRKVADLSGKFAYNDKDQLVFTFGTHKDKVASTEIGYLDWMLKGNFPPDTKKVIRGILESVKTVRR